VTRALPLLVVCCLLAVACGARTGEPAPPGLLRSVDGGTAAQPSATATPSLPPPTPELRPTATPALISEVLPAAVPPESAPVTGGTSLPMPAGTKVVWGGCASDGRCYPYNFYWAPAHEAVMQAGEPSHKVQHELCHAHQHWAINEGGPLSPSDYDLESWYATAEGGSFTASVAGLPWPWSHSAVNGLEDFAWTCAYWYLEPAHLLAVSPERYAWAAANLP